MGRHLLRTSAKRVAWTTVLFIPLSFGANVPGRYIVELTSDPAIEYAARISKTVRLRTPDTYSHLAKIHAEQQKTQSWLEQRNARVLDRVDTVANALIVEADDAAASQLASAPGVKPVHPVRLFHLVLDRAVALHNIPAVWDQIGSDRAGAGIRIGIIDTGIESTNTAFQDSSLPAVDSFPRVTAASDLAYTSAKIIVARSYVNLLPYRDPDRSARDHVGHGTALAMIAAGQRIAGPLATITGVAPRAYLGNYKVFGTPGYNDSASDDAILKAIDDAVSDGMDVLNLSFGDDLAPRLEDDIEVQAVERAVKAGVIVVVAAGNNGPLLNTLSSPATAPSAISVGATTNDRTFGASVRVSGMDAMLAIPGSGPAPSAEVSGPVLSVGSLDGNGLGCSSFTAGSLNRSVALIKRGTCTFESKLNNAARAGAVGAIVYAAEDAPEPFTMGAGAATLPAEMVSYTDGIRVRDAIGADSVPTATLRFTLSAVNAAGNLPAGFSAAGPNVDLGIKPDLTAVGQDVYVTTETIDSNGDMYSANGFALVDGTSFSTPLVAGAAALIKSARPGLTVDQYRSILINTAANVSTKSGEPALIQQIGAGRLDAIAALRSTAAVAPVSLSFGSAPSPPARPLTLTNLGPSADTFAIEPVSIDGGPAPVAQSSSVQIEPGASAEVPIFWNDTSLGAGAHHGFIQISSSSSGTRLTVPYWYAVQSGTPANVVILYSLSSGRRGTVQRDAIAFRVTDAAGLNLTDGQPVVTVISGGGAAGDAARADSSVPGLFSVDVQLGVQAGTNVFRIQAGSASADVSITGR